jgi:hypothetical protein
VAALAAKAAALVARVAALAAAWDAESSKQSDIVRKHLPELKFK